MDLPSSFLNIRKRIADACHRCGREPASVKLIAASKAQTPTRIAELHALGQKFFGENYAVELIKKTAELPSSIEWSYIGQLQSNKIKRIMGAAHEIQSVASLKHVRLIAQYAEELAKAPYPIFLELNIPNDTTKAGLAFGELDRLVEQILTQYPQLALQGIMAVPPQRFANHWDSEGEALYRNLRKLADGVGAGQLSLGMSADLEHAIACGSDILRIGSALMGART